MFTGIIECMGTVNSVISSGSNLSFWIRSPLSSSLKPDQSVSHDGVCLTVEEVKGETHLVTAIAETLNKTNISSWKAGSSINLERCLVMNGRIDGHIVQGHVDCTAKCVKIKEKEGSREMVFSFPGKFAELMIEKGSVCVNGISLTAFNVEKKKFTVAIIPYTSTLTNISMVQPGDRVNLEFDMVGKYIQRKLSLKKN